MKKMMKAMVRVLFLLLLQVSVSGLFVQKAEAATAIPYTLGNVITLEGDDNYQYAFEITQRTKVKVHMEAYANASSSAYCEFKFEVQDYSVKDYMVYDEWVKVYPGQIKDLELTFQPGKYLFSASGTRQYANMQAGSFSITTEQVIPEPVNKCTVGKDGSYTTVSNIMGKAFSALDYQYENKIRYHISLKEKTQIKIEVTRGTSEYVEYNDRNDYDDVFTVQEAEVTGRDYKFTDANGVEKEKWKVSPGTTSSATVTLLEGDYWIIQDRDTYRTDFTVKISQGPTVATKIKLNKKKITIQPEEKYIWLSHTTYPENGTAKVTYKSDNPKIAKVNKKTGEVTAVKEGKTKIRACLPNGAQAVCTVTVKEKTALAKVESQVGNTTYHDKVSLTVWNDTDELFLNSYNAYTYYRLYRSTKKNGKYKLIATKKVRADFRFEIFTDKKVKSNTRYYYKASVKTPGRKKYGPLSKPVAYWTAPSPNVNITSDGQVVTWNKNKQANGYIVAETWTTDAGYNIFFQKLFDAHTKSSVTEGTSYRRLHYDKHSKVSLRTYAKHGKYYYVSGEKVTPKKSTFIFEHTERHVRN